MMRACTSSYTLVGIVAVVIAVAGLCSKFDLPSP